MHSNQQHEAIITAMDVTSPIITKLSPVKPKITKNIKSIKTNS